MREIEFRGKASIDKYSYVHQGRAIEGIWIFGDLIHDGYNGALMINPHIGDYEGDCIFVHPETVGQYTGIKDSNGKKIYEGDIIRYEDLSTYDAVEESIKKDDPEDQIEHEWETVVVKWFGDDGYPAFDVEPNLADDSNSISCLVQSGNYYFEVIGNIHDNPELLKAQNDRT
ncbi:MAG: YopX family protein [Treponema sp.]|nr:YopX family protein [Treponema sp.]